MRPSERLLRRGIPNTAIRKALEDWSDRLSVWERIWTAIVIAGLGIEIFAALSRFLPHNVFDLIWPHLTVLGDIATAMVFGGVLGELIVSSRAGRVETDLRKENNRLAQEASERVLQAEKKLRRRTESRFLPEDEKVKLVELLRPFAGQEFIAIPSESRSEGIVAPNKALERAVFAGQLHAVCLEAGWVPKIGTTILGTNVATGIVVFVPESPVRVPPPAAHALVDALIHLDIPCQFGSFKESHLPLLLIAVGLIS